jgi:hypothetical protein
MLIMVIKKNGDPVTICTTSQLMIHALDQALCDKISDLNILVDCSQKSILPAHLLDGT